MKNPVRKSMLFAALMALIAPASAGPFTADFIYTSASLGGSSIGHSLSITNTDGAGNSLDSFRVFLDADTTLNLAGTVIIGYGFYTNLMWTNDQAGAGWSSIFVDSASNFGGPGEFGDAKFPGPGIADGATLGVGYKFDYSGSLLQSQQTFSYEAIFGLCDDTGGTGACAGLTELDPGSGVYYAGKSTGHLMYDAGTPPGPQPTPEPMTLSLLGIGLLGLAFSGRRRRG